MLLIEIFTVHLPFSVKPCGIWGQLHFYLHLSQFWGSVQPETVVSRLLSFCRQGEITIPVPGSPLSNSTMQLLDAGEDFGKPCSLANSLPPKYKFHDPLNRPTGSE